MSSVTLIVTPASVVASSEALDRPIETVIDEALELSDGGKVRLGAVLDAWGDRSYGPLFIILGFFAGSPLAIIPPTAAVAGCVIAVLALQMLCGKNHPWLPQWILRSSVKERKLIKARDKSVKTVSFLDDLVSERMTWASGSVARRLAAVVVLALGLSMIPFEAVPFAGVAPAFGVVLFGVAITARDGLVMLISTATAIGVAVLASMVF